MHPGYTSFRHYTYLPKDSQNILQAIVLLLSCMRCYEIYLMHRYRIVSAYKLCDLEERIILAIFIFSFYTCARSGKEMAESHVQRNISRVTQREDFTDSRVSVYHVFDNAIQRCNCDVFLAIECTEDPHVNFLASKRASRTYNTSLVYIISRNNRLKLRAKSCSIAPRGQTSLHKGVKSSRMKGLLSMGRETDQIANRLRYFETMRHRDCVVNVKIICILSHFSQSSVASLKKKTIFFRRSQITVQLSLFLR